MMLVVGQVLPQHLTHTILSILTLQSQSRLSPWLCPHDSVPMTWRRKLTHSRGYSPEVTCSKEWSLSLNPGNMPQGPLMESLCYTTRYIFLTQVFKNMYFEDSWTYPYLLFLLIFLFLWAVLGRVNFTSDNLKVKKYSSWQDCILLNTSKRVKHNDVWTHQFHLFLQSFDPVSRHPTIEL